MSTDETTMSADETTIAHALSSSEAVLWAIERDPSCARPSSSWRSWRSLRISRLRERLASAAHAFPRLRQRVQPRRTGYRDGWTSATWTSTITSVGSSAASGILRRPPAPGRAAGRRGVRRARPLWQMTVVEGLDGGRAAVVIKVHHAVTDGVGGVGLLPAFTDPEPCPNENGATSAGDRGISPPSSSGPPRLRLLGTVGSALGEALAHPVSAADSAPRVVRSIGKLLAPATRALSPVTTARGLDRHLDTLDVPIEDLAAPGDRSAGRSTTRSSRPSWAGCAATTNATAPKRKSFG